jgi:phospholipid-binding lipoprotein MlaA
VSALPALIAALVLAGCGSFSSAVRSDSALTAAASLTALAPPDEAPEAPAPDPAVFVALLEPAGLPSTPVAAPASDGAQPDELRASEPMLAQAPLTPTAEPAESESDEEYDPLEKFNEVMFDFNRQLDRFVLKPVAQVYSWVIPEPIEILIANGFDNIAFVPRAANSVFQGKWGGAVREVSRFLINSTLGIGGVFDAARYWGIEKSREDFGQTLGFWGLGPGPYLVLPFLEPMTFRDGIGRGVDVLMNPLTWLGPPWYFSLALKTAEIVNDRALNLELFQGLEESVIDLYSAVRNGYLRRREQMIRE